MTQVDDRLGRVRRNTRWINALQRRRIGAPLVSIARDAPFIGTWLRDAIGCRGAFRSLAAAQAAAAHDGGAIAGQDTLANVELHEALARSPRVSDYPAMLHLGGIFAAEPSLLDLGGNAGNLFYLYARYLPVPPDFRWIVQELPLVAEAGARLAAGRNERRLRFTDDPTAFSGARVLLASGALQYWDKPLATLLEDSGARPVHVLVNRTPLSPAQTYCTVQDGGGYLAPATIHARASVVDGMSRLGYTLVDEWTAPDLSLAIPLSPELSVAAYSGFYWRRTEP